MAEKDIQEEGNEAVTVPPDTTAAAGGDSVFFKNCHFRARGHLVRENWLIQSKAKNKEQQKSPKTLHHVNLQPSLVAC